MTDDELGAEIQWRLADVAVRERLASTAQPSRPGSGVLMPHPDDL